MIQTADAQDAEGLFWNDIRNINDYLHLDIINCIVNTLKCKIANIFLIFTE